MEGYTQRDCFEIGVEVSRLMDRVTNFSKRDDLTLAQKLTIQRGIAELDIARRTFFAVMEDA